MMVMMLMTMDAADTVLQRGQEYDQNGHDDDGGMPSGTM